MATTTRLGAHAGLGHAEAAACPLSAMSATDELEIGLGRRWALFGLGWLAAGTGTLGIFVPLLPTTCFLLLAGWCFKRSSPRFDRWLHRNRLFGAYLTSYERDRAVPARVKNGSLLLLWSSVALTLMVLAPPPWVVAGLSAVVVAVSWHVAGLRTTEVST